MKQINWDQEKNKKFQKERGVSFEKIVICIENGYILDVKKNSSEKYKHQRVFIVGINEYVYYVPFVENEEGIFLKTIVPSRKLTREYLKGRKKQ